MVILGTCPLVGAPFCGAPVPPNVLNMSKSASALNKVHVAATELPQLLSQNTMFGEAAAQSRCQTLCSSKVA